MKRKNLVWFLLVLAVVVLVMLTRSPGKLERSAAPAPALASLRSEAPLPDAAAAAQTARLLLKPQAMAEPPLMLAMAEKEQKFREDVERGNKPINFWAKVVDQNDRPLAGAVVIFGVRGWTTGPDLDVGVIPKFRELRLVSDANGHVKATGERGDAATVRSVQLEGYVMSEASRIRLLPSNRPSPMAPISSADNPILIRMWRKLSPERLVFTSKGLSVPCDGTPVYLDLVTGKSGTNSAPCDMVLTLLREPQDLLRNQIKQFNWSLDIQMPDGGLQTNVTEFPYLAPADGYTNRLYQAYLTNEAGWKRVAELALFIHNRRGQHYGHVKFRVEGGWGEGPVIFLRYEAIINPAGSRNLEYDWKLRIEPQRSVANTPTQTAIPPDFTRAVSPSPIPRIIPQPPPGFQALTNRANPLTQPTPPRQQ